MNSALIHNQNRRVAGLADYMRRYGSHCNSRCHDENDPVIKREYFGNKIHRSLEINGYLTTFRSRSFIQGSITRNARFDFCA